MSIVELLTQAQQLGQWRDVTIHAEQAIGHDQLGRGITARQHVGQGLHVAVRVDLHLGARQACTVDQRGMIE